MKKPARSPLGKRFKGVRPAKSLTSPRSIKPLATNFVKKSKKS